MKPESSKDSENSSRSVDRMKLSTTQAGKITKTPRTPAQDRLKRLKKTLATDMATLVEEAVTTDTSKTEKRQNTLQNRIDQLRRCPTVCVAYEPPMFLKKANKPASVAVEERSAPTVAPHVRNEGTKESCIGIASLGNATTPTSTMEPSKPSKLKRNREGTSQAGVLKTSALSPKRNEGRRESRKRTASQAKATATSSPQKPELPNTNIREVPHTSQLKKHLGDISQRGELKSSELLHFKRNEGNKESRTRTGSQAKATATTSPQKMEPRNANIREVPHTSQLKKHRGDISQRGELKSSELLHVKRNEGNKESRTRTASQAKAIAAISPQKLRPPNTNILELPHTSEPKKSHEDILHGGALKPSVLLRSRPMEGRKEPRTRTASQDKDTATTSPQHQIMELPRIPKLRRNQEGRFEEAESRAPLCPKESKGNTEPSTSTVMKLPRIAKLKRNHEDTVKVDESIVPAGGFPNMEDYEMEEATPTESKMSNLRVTTRSQCVQVPLPILASSSADVTTSKRSSGEPKVKRDHHLGKLKEIKRLSHKSSNKSQQKTHLTAEKIQLARRTSSTEKDEPMQIASVEISARIVQENLTNLVKQQQTTVVKNQPTEIREGLEKESSPPNVSFAIPGYAKGSANSRLDRFRQNLQQECQSMGLIVSKGPSHSTGRPQSSPTSLAPECANDESMDWEDDVQDVRASSSVARPSSNTQSLETYKSDLFSRINTNLKLFDEQNRERCRRTRRNDLYYFVLDTNVLLWQLRFVEQLMTMKLCGTEGSVVVIPYRAVRELEKLKWRPPSESVKVLAIRANKFINEKLKECCPQIEVQGAAHNNLNIIDIETPDDDILDCCIQLLQQVEKVMLLTEDSNLRTKAIANGIVVATKSDLTTVQPQTSKRWV